MNALHAIAAFDVCTLIVGAYLYYRQIKINEMLDAATFIVGGIIGVSILAVLVSRNANTKEVIDTSNKSFKDILNAAHE